MPPPPCTLALHCARCSGPRLHAVRAGSSAYASLAPSDAAHLFLQRILFRINSLCHFWCVWVRACSRPAHQQPLLVAGVVGTWGAAPWTAPMLLRQPRPFCARRFDDIRSYENDRSVHLARTRDAIEVRRAWLLLAK